MSNYADRFGEDDPGRIGTRMMAQSYAKRKITSDTSTSKLADLILKSDVVEVTKAEYSYQLGMGYKNLSVATFMEALQALSNAGIFSETIKWKHRIDAETRTVTVSGDFNDKTAGFGICVHLKLKTGITPEQVEKKLRVTD